LTQGTTRDDSPDYIIFLTVTVLLAIGIVMVYSSSAVKAQQLYGDGFYFLKRQIVWAVIGLSLMAAAMWVDHRYLRALAKPGLWIALFLLLVVLVPGVGRATHGARRWVELGPLSFNPSEAMKLAFVVYLADYLARAGERIRSFTKGLLPPLAVLGVSFLLILQQPDLGTAIALAGTAVLMLFCSGARLGHLVALFFASLPAVTWMIFGEQYRRRRFLAFLDPGADPSGAGYHIIQALYALGSGGLFGVGLGRSRQKFFYLPEEHTDFIFAIIGEELGFVGAVTVIGLFFFFLWRGYRVAITSPDTFAGFLAMGLTTMIGLQAVVNIGVVTGTLPITGIPLPFISFGGSSLVFTLLGVGILLNVSRYSS